MNGASTAAVTLSSMPFQGPNCFDADRLAFDGELVPFPTQDALEESDLDLIVSGNRKESDPDDRGLRPRNTRGSDGPGLIAWRPTSYIRQICDAAGRVGREG